MHTILVLRGYGFFGQRICEVLAKEMGVYLLVAGRNGNKAQELARLLGPSANHGHSVDATAPTHLPLHLDCHSFCLNRLVP